ncbi:hypothetical protein MKX08_009598 [Trichoderma sp. CBMAI-0020]|nr:hypothetical protein MKX08_009598 [Trichoderma sp. CBMAI-0020]
MLLITQDTTTYAVYKNPNIITITVKNAAFTDLIALNITDLLNALDKDYGIHNWKWCNNIYY